MIYLSIIGSCIGITGFILSVATFWRAKMYKDEGDRTATLRSLAEVRLNMERLSEEFVRDISLVKFMSKAMESRVKFEKQYEIFVLVTKGYFYETESRVQFLVRKLKDDKFFFKYKVELINALFDFKNFVTGDFRKLYTKELKIEELNGLVEKSVAIESYVNGKFANFLNECNKAYEEISKCPLRKIKLIKQLNANEKQH